MALFRPTALRERATEIDGPLLASLGVRALLLDVDNTIATYSGHRPAPGTLAWAERLRGEGYRLIIVSNNYRKRVSGFAAEFGLDFISFAMKPFPLGYLRARKRLGLRCRECAIIGDQIFTDVIGANLCGMKSVLLRPMEAEPGLSFRVRRRLERPLRRRYEAALGQGGKTRPSG